MSKGPPEFDCCECGRHIVAMGLERAPEPPLCMHCIAMPEWFKDPELRQLFDPDHDGTEEMDRA